MKTLYRIYDHCAGEWFSGGRSSGWYTKPGNARNAISQIVSDIIWRNRYTIRYQTNEQLISADYEIFAFDLTNQRSIERVVVEGGEQNSVAPDITDG